MACSKFESKVYFPPKSRFHRDKIMPFGVGASMQSWTCLNACRKHSDQFLVLPFSLFVQLGTAGPFCLRSYHFISKNVSSWSSFNFLFENHSNQFLQAIKVNYCTISQWALDYHDLDQQHSPHLCDHNQTLNLNNQILISINIFVIIIRLAGPTSRRHLLR